MRWQLRGVTQTFDTNSLGGPARINEIGSGNLHERSGTNNVPAVIVVYSPASCLLLQSGFEETESFRDSRSPLYVENPPPVPTAGRPSLSRYTDDSVYFRTRPRRNTYVSAKLLSRHQHARARARTRFRVGKYLPSYVHCWRLSHGIVCAKSAVRSSTQI